MAKAPIRVAVTGAAGNIGYALLFRIASGEMFGKDQPLILQLLEIPVEGPQKALKGVAMELEDWAFPLLTDMVLTGEADVAFKDANWCLLVGSKPRGPGMERADLLKDNGKIFVAQGKAIDAVAADNARIAVVGNPCNTNCLIARGNAPDVPAERWFALTRLDQNRGQSLLAARAGAAVEDVSNLAVWGNHSATQFPDARNARIGGRPVPEVIADEAWLLGEFVTSVQQRGAAVLKARGLSSAASAANAAIDSVNSVRSATPEADWTSLAVVSRGEYGIPEGLQFGFPVRTDGTTWQVVETIELDDRARAKIRTTTEELEGERAEVKHLIPG